LYRTAQAIEWADFFSVDNTFAVFATVSNSKINHSQYAAFCLKDSIVDYFRSRLGGRPNIDTNDPDVWINLHIENNHAVISFDTSGGSLHRRGYRKAPVEAPMQETLAAAIIRLSDWNGSQPVYDPMCGSGTLLCEALMHYCRIPSGFLRKRFGFEFLPDFDQAVWKSVKKEADEQIRPFPYGLIAGSDVSSEAIAASETNTHLLPHGENIRLQVMDFQDIEGLENSIIVCNPPYGIRTGKDGNIAALYKTFGQFLKQRCTGSSACIYFGDKSLIRHIELRPSWKKALKNGGLDGRLARFELY